MVLKEDKTQLRQSLGELTRRKINIMIDIMILIVVIDFFLLRQSLNAQLLPGFWSLDY